MTPENWKRVKDLYEAALELEPEARTRYIEDAAKDDEAVRSEALAMIHANASVGDFLDYPIIRTEVIAAPATTSSVFLTGHVIGGRFRIENLIARGGMGAVYRATDLELNRVVALKTVRSTSMLKEQLRARLRQEAQLISKLNHPAICTLYDVRQHAGIDYLVMEFLDGESLANRLSQGPVPLPQSIEIALDILSALDYAHKQGVIHRDIKLANVMLTDSGTKLLDFGIAKLRNPESKFAHFDGTEPLTPAGFLVGTPPYMAPEQLRKGMADVRSDIYSFGVLFYKLLAGSPDAPVTLMTQGPIKTPFEQIIRKCLAENPADRWQDSGDLRAALELASRQPLEAYSEGKSTRRHRTTTAAMVGIAAISIVLFVFSRHTAVPEARLEFQLFPPDGQRFVSIEQGGPPMISPDGSTVAFVAKDPNPNGDEKLWLRRIDSISATAVAGTEGANHPFWSPDSRTIAFFARNRLMSIEVNGGTPKLICEAREGRGGTWGPNGIIVFSPGYTDPLLRVASTGGIPVPITTINTDKLENSHRWPFLLPDGKHVLFVIRAFGRERSGLYVVPLQGGEAKRIEGIESSAIYVPDLNGGLGHLLYVRNSQVIAQAFRTDTFTLTGDTVAVAELGWTDTSTTRAPVSVSNTGVLVYGGGQSANSQLVWHDLFGKSLTSLNVAGTTRFLRLSPDTRTVALEKLDFRFGSGSLWLLESERERATRFTYEPMSAYSPVWSPDGTSLAFSLHKGTEFDLIATSIEGGTNKVLVNSTQAEPVIATDWTNEGLILYEMRNPGTGWDLYALSLNDPGVHQVLLNSNADERQARISPDGHWLAYTSNESGRQEVYVRRSFKSGPRFQISSTGGSQPVWSQHSPDIYFVDGSRRLVRGHIDFRLQRAETPTPLFQLPPSTDSSMIAGWEYDVARDGSRFLTGLSGSVQESKPATVIHGWVLPH